MWSALLLAGCAAASAGHPEDAKTGKGELAAEDEPETMSGLEAVHWLAALSLASTCPWDDPDSLEAAGCNADVTDDLTSSIAEVSWYLTYVADVAGLTVRDDGEKVSMLTSPQPDDDGWVELDAERALGERVAIALEDRTALEIGSTPLEWWDDGHPYFHPDIHPAALPAEASSTDAWAAHLALELEIGGDGELPPLVIQVDIDLIQLTFGGAQTSLFAPEDLWVQVSWNPFKAAAKLYDNLIDRTATGLIRKQQLKDAQVIRGMTQGKIKPGFGISENPAGTGRRMAEGAAGKLIGQTLRKNYLENKQQGTAGALAQSRKQATNTLHRDLKKQGPLPKPLTGRTNSSSSSPKPSKDRGSGGKTKKK